MIMLVKKDLPALSLSTEHGEVAHHHLVKGAVSTTSSKASGSAAPVQSNLEDIVVISDGESDELVGEEHEVGATPIEGNEKENKDASASNKQSSPLLEHCAVVNSKV
jgi:IMP dehydrogenase/GMP reductase